MNVSWSIVLLVLYKCLLKIVLHLTCVKANNNIFVSHGQQSVSLQYSEKNYKQGHQIKNQGKKRKNSLPLSYNSFLEFQKPGCVISGTEIRVGQF